MFKDPRTLAELYPPFVRHAMEHFKSPDVMRFLGRKAHGNFTGEIVTSCKNRPEGVRVKHWVRGNSVKMYEKAGVGATPRADRRTSPSRRPRRRRRGENGCSTTRLGSRLRLFR